MEGLEKSYGTLAVLGGVSFEVERGSIFALLGSNGSGKTTTVRILATLLRDGGVACVNGFDVAADPGSARESFSLTGQFAAVDEIVEINVSTTDRYLPGLIEVASGESEPREAIATAEG